MKYAIRMVLGLIFMSGTITVQAADVVPGTVVEIKNPISTGSLPQLNKGGTGTIGLSIPVIGNVIEQGIRLPTENAVTKDSKKPSQNQETRVEDMPKP